ncbi:hypothetical protein MN032_08845 [Agromyces atrinae]|uniref:hypothetical protein n=1 Tax=Agromyces atrinae TaxID=592376 RepID=UPI001F55EF87|nr:hypothetical protein [Agromyces atrinae]MCI2957797.1 hypothetical protein [Agromyces atrinae]
MKTTDNRLVLLGLAVAAIAVMLLGFFLGVIPLLASADAARGREREVNAQNVLLENDIARLAALAETRDADEARLAEQRIALPEDHAQPAFLREVDALATASGAALRSYTFSEPTGYAVDPPADDRLGSGNYFSTTVQFELVGTRAVVLDAVRRLQGTERLFVVESVAISLDSAAAGDEPDQFDPNVAVAAVVSGEIFMLVSGAAPVFVAPEPGSEADDESVAPDDEATAEATP